ncbi:14951_t:CDS:1, partial [Acaulospora morrowiae]
RRSRENEVSYQHELRLTLEYEKKCEKRAVETIEECEVRLICDRNRKCQKVVLETDEQREKHLNDRCKRRYQLRTIIEHQNQNVDPQQQFSKPQNNKNIITTHINLPITAADI